MRRAIVLLGFGLCACARFPAPSEPSARALFRDLERQVTVAAADGGVFHALRFVDGSWTQLGKVKDVAGDPGPVTRVAMSG